MNRTPRLSKSGIEYLDYVWNFYSGCLHKLTAGICPVEKCWAEEITIRFADNYPNGFRPTYYPEAFLSPLYLKKPSIIGCDFMGDLFGDWVDPNKQFLFEDGYNSLKQIIFFVIRACPQHTFLFLTKRPQNYALWEPFPDNCWVGVTATDDNAFTFATHYLEKVEAKVKYISFEPLLTVIDCGKPWDKRLKLAGIKWVIIGAQTKPTVYPLKEWVEEIVLAADKDGMKVFLKDNMASLFRSGEPSYWAINSLGFLRQEMPNEMHQVQKQKQEVS